MRISVSAAVLACVVAVSCGATEREGVSRAGGGGSAGVARVGVGGVDVTLGGAGASPSDAVGGVAGAEAGGSVSDAGAGGAEMGGSAGNAGHAGVGGCSSGQRPAFEPRCDEPTFTMGTSTCGAALTREVLQCGVPGSQFDARCCYRTVCDNDTDCGGGRCLPLLTQSPWFPTGSLYESCELDCGECYCTVTADYNLRSYCVAANARLEEFNCDVRGLSCDTLRGWAENLGSQGGSAGAAGAVSEGVFPFVDDVSPHFMQHVQLCAAKIAAARRASCSD